MKGGWAVNRFSGYKTYLVAIAMLTYAWVGVGLGKVTPDHAVETTFEALAIAGLRNGIKAPTK